MGVIEREIAGPKKEKEKDVMTKEDMRRAIQIERLRRAPGWIDEHSRKAVNHLCRLDVLHSAKAVSGYVATRSEVQIQSFLERCLNEERRVCVPRHRAGTRAYEWSWVAAGDAWHNGPWSIPEPTRFQPVEPAEIEVAIVPAVAVDRKGRRLGHGGGNFDRLMRELTCPRVAVVFEFQILDEIPTEAHDVPVDFIVTETGAYPAGDR